MRNFQDNFLMGTALDATESIYYKKTSVGSVFFKPFESKSHFFYNATTIVAAPIFAATITASFALKLCAELLNTLASLLVFDLEDTLKHSTESVQTLMPIFIFPVIAVISPLINSVDFFGSCITSLMPKGDEPGSHEGRRRSAREGTDGSMRPMNP